MSDQITTVEELEALPNGSVVMDDDGQVCQRRDYAGGWWWATGIEPVDTTSVFLYGGPLRVVYRPDRPSGVSPEQVEALMRGRLKWASTHWDVPDDECLRALAEAVALGLRVEGELDT